MHTPAVIKSRALLIMLCCLIPLAALAATLFLNAPAWPTVVIALALLAPLAAQLLAEGGSR